MGEMNDVEGADALLSLAALAEEAYEDAPLEDDLEEERPSAPQPPFYQRPLLSVHQQEKLEEHSCKGT